MIRWLGSRALNAAGLLESALLSSRELRSPPLFVIGPPRSGTTVLGQVVAHSLDVSYFPNAAVQLCTGLRHPPIVTATRLARLARGGRSEADFVSHGGRGVGALSSGDSDFVWRFIVPDGFLDEKSLEASVASKVRKIVGGIERLHRKPFVDKSVGHSLRVRAFSALFDGALFIRTRRNPLAVAQSVLLARTIPGSAGKVELPAGHGPTAWPTPFTRGWEELSRRPLIEQAARQQALFDADIDDGARDLPAGRMLDVDYESLCRAPRDEMRRIVAFMTAGGAESRIIREPPETLRYSNSRRLDAAVYDSLARLVDHAYAGRFEPLAEAEGETA